MSKVKGYFKFCPRCAHRLEWHIEHRDEPRRQSCPRCHFTFYNNPVGCIEALIIRDGKFLMVLRGKHPRKNFWDFPGGFLEDGEHSEQGVIREVQEELGVRFSPQRLLCGFADIYRWQGRSIPTIGFSYVGTIAGRIKTNYEIGKLRWFPLSRLPKRLAFKHMHHVLRDLRRYLKHHKPTEVQRIEVDS